ncbi:helix-turn-helix transcriptional regulator [Paraburkholderia pallida]|nr:helix-turn-helix transcriptional regulator [Paraburkholderia pallida]
MEIRTIDVRQDPSPATLLSVQLIEQIGDALYVERLRESVAEVVKYAHVGLLSFSRHSPPQLIGTESLIARDLVIKVSSRYIGGQYQADPVCRIGASARQWDGLVYVQRQRAEEVEDAEYRASCYETTGIVDRVSLSRSFDDGHWIAVNLYRDASQGCFDHWEYSRLMAIAPVLTTAACKHLQLIRAIGSPPSSARIEAATVAERLARLGPRLSKREFEVCCRIVQGLTAKEIARELGIAPTSVAEHRKNAYAKLSVRDHKQLFALVLPGTGLQ